MSGFGVIGPESQSHLDWCRNLWERANDRAVWGIPRSGLVFQKNEQERMFILVERMTHDPSMPITAEQLREQQDEEIEAVRQRFASIGVRVIG